MSGHFREIVDHRPRVMQRPYGPYNSVPHTADGREFGSTRPGSPYRQRGTRRGIEQKNLESLIGRFRINH